MEVEVKNEIKEEVKLALISLKNLRLIILSLLIKYMIQILECIQIMMKDLNQKLQLLEM